MCPVVVAFMKFRWNEFVTRPRLIFSCLLLCLLSGMPVLSRAQTFADLRSISFSPSGNLLPARLERPATFGNFAANRCSTSMLPPGSGSSAVIDRISLELAATPLFVAKYPGGKYSGAERSCSASRNGMDAGAPGAPTAIPAGVFCSPAAILPVSPICGMWSDEVYIRTWDILRPAMVRPAKIVGSQRTDQKFQWKPALLQSVEFLLFEHAFRLVDDPYLRYLLFHKPFWHDYLVSAGQFDMSRWGDGDDFLVNYIGHPMQGGVTGNIYIQNDPRARGLKFGKSSAYWQSRMRAMAWSAVYSAYFEIGPVLSEVALGNEAGYTYTPGCGHYVCDRPGYKPPTNNTGWVDFIVTPTMGTGLMILEDSIDREIMDRFFEDDSRFGIKVVRSMLSPTHSMANMLAGRKPWFRFSDDAPERSAAFGPAVDPRLDRDESWKYEHRWSAGLHYTNIDLPMDWPGCPACRVHSSGAGFTLGYRLTKLISFDSELNVFPRSGSENGKSRAEELLAGVKIGRTLGSWGLFTTMRPGFIHYDKTLAPGSQTDYESANRFAFDAGGVVEYYASSRSTIRFDIGTTFVRYLTGHPDPRQLPQTVLSDDYIATQGNFHLGSGYVFRF
jgi:hypothetical protein